MTITTYNDREIKLQKELALEKQLAQLNGEIAAELKAERDTLRQRLAEALALIEASRKQEPAGVLRSDEFDGHVFEPTSGWPFGKLYAAPVVADDVPSVNCDTCVYHYKDADQKPCNTCIHSGDFVSNFEPRITGAKK